VAIGDHRCQRAIKGGPLKRGVLKWVSTPGWWFLGMTVAVAGAGGPLPFEAASATLPNWERQVARTDAVSSFAAWPLAAVHTDFALTSRAASGSSGAARVIPRVGGPRETFIVRFRSPYATYGDFEEGAAAYFEVQVRGPRPCRTEGSDLISSERFEPGDSVVMLISLLRRTRWCHGRYRAWIDYVRDNSRGTEILRQRVLSNLAFKVVNRQPRSPFAVSPRVGGPRETFVVRFVSPFPVFEEEPLSEGDSNRDAYYRLELRGPRGCKRLSTTSFRDLALVRGDRVLITLFPTFMTPIRRRWCTGRYVGRLSWVRTTDGAVEVERVVRRRIALRVIP
jgi:hypothetical protein